MSVLQYHGLSLENGGTPILDRIEASIEGPGVFALLGPSGVGKSSLLRATQRLIEDGRAGWRRRGDVRFNGRSVFDPALRLRHLARQIGFVQQRPRMLGGSVLANVAFALRHTTRLPRAAIQARAEAALERVGLLDELDDLGLAAWRLSGGQAQRLAIARAIALEPEAMLMDEPISALDPISAERVEAVIRAIARDRLVVLVTHKVGLAVRLADSAAFMLRGAAGARLVECGPAPAIFERPRDPVAREFVRMGYGKVDDAAVRAAADERLEASPSRPVGARRRWARRVYLFVCGGNTSRSPIAQAICNAEIVRRLGGEAAAVRAWSAGLDIVPERPMAPDAEGALSALGFAPHQHRTRPLTAELVAGADAVFCMTDAQCRTLRARFPEAAPKVERLDPISDLGNPAGRSPAVYRRTAERIRDAVRWRLANDGMAAAAGA